MFPNALAAALNSKMSFLKKKKFIFSSKYCHLLPTSNRDLKFGDWPNLCRVKKSRCFTFIENIFRSGLTLVSSWDCFCQENSGICHFNFHNLKGEDSNYKDDECKKSWCVAPMKTLEYWHRPRLGWANSNLDFAYCNHLFKSFYLSLY